MLLPMKTAHNCTAIKEVSIASQITWITLIASSLK